MFTSFIGWVKGLSVAGKVAMAVVGAGAVGVVAMPDTSSPAPVTEDVTAEPKASITTETLTETEVIDFTKQSVETSSLNKGMTQITTPGVNGARTITYKVTKSNGIQTSKEQVKSEVTTQPVVEVTSVGTYETPAPRSNCDPNYSPCVPLVSYDLDCPDIGFSVRVLGSDPHGFDGNDNDGYGCESY